MPIHLLYNSEISGGNIRASIQQLLDSGLGLLWSDVQAAWVEAAAVPFNDRTTQCVEQAVGDNAIAYYGQAAFADETFTGRIIKGYHDANAGNVLLFSEIGYVRRGEELSFVLAEDRVNREVARTYVFEVRKRQGTNTYAAKQPIVISTHDDIDFTYNLPAIFPSCSVVSKIYDIEVYPSGELKVVSLGPQGGYPILSLDGGQVAGKDYTVSCMVMLATGESVKCEGTFTCVA